MRPAVGERAAIIKMGCGSVLALIAVDLLVSAAIPALVEPPPPVPSGFNVGLAVGGVLFGLLTVVVWVSARRTIRAAAMPLPSGFRGFRLVVWLIAFPLGLFGGWSVNLWHGSFDWHRGVGPGTLGAIFSIL